MESVEDLKLRGNEEFKKRDYKKAVEYYSAALSLDPRNFMILSNRSNAYFNMQLYDESLVDANTCVQIQSYSKGYFRKGNFIHSHKTFKKRFGAFIFEPISGSETSF